MKKLFLLFVLIGLISCDDLIEVVDISKETVIILAPTQGSAIDTTRVVFTWEPVKEAENYHLQVATPTFENAIQIVVDTLLMSTSYSGQLEKAEYEWRIKAENSDYQTKFTKSRFRVE